VRLLLDTHTFLWWCAADARLSAAAVQAISDAESEVFVSAVSAWEISIKARLGKLPLPEHPKRFMTQMLARHAFGTLVITPLHALAEHDLPVLHHDPFDRLLIAQARLEGLRLVTNDAEIARYGMPMLW
jgi:PIN domain nuclease of toxin-antitoxin system